MIVNISGTFLKLPSICACCEAHTKSVATLTAERVTGVRVVRTQTRVIEMTYCERCQTHARHWPDPWSFVDAVLAVLSLSIWVFYKIIHDEHKMRTARALCSESCCGPRWAAQFIGWHGSVKSVGFASERVAAQFALANMKSLVNVAPALQGALERALAERRMSAEELLVEEILGGVEEAKGPAARRAMVARGLKNLTQRDLRDRLVRDAARLGAISVLDKAEKLKSHAAKRRALEDGLAELREDNVDDELLALIRTGNLRPTLLTFAAEHAGRISDSAKVTEALIPLLTHPKAYVREGALYGLRLHKTPDVCSRISELLSVEPIAEIREIASEILEEDAT